jgi:hypothetical protein
VVRTAKRFRVCYHCLSVHVPTEDKNDDKNDRFYEELERVFDKFPKYQMNILLRDFNTRLGGEDVFKVTTGNENLHEISNDNELG